MKLKKCFLGASVMALSIFFNSCDENEKNKTTTTKSEIESTSVETTNSNESKETRLESSESQESKTMETSSESKIESSIESKMESSIESIISTNTETEIESTISYNKVKTTVYMVGDSTMCNYDPLDSYYYPRYGYGTQLNKYLDSDYVTVKNLAMSGRSSYSFLSESNYSTLLNNISKGDYLIIGWGHNDEKYGTSTYRNAKYDSIEKALQDKDSFQTCLYENYIKVAENKGAYPILATPIVRYDATFNYTGDKIHNTQYGDYRQAIIDVASYYEIPYVDLTTITKDIYKEEKENALLYHAIYSGTDESQGALPNMQAFDATHINYYGANMVSYNFVRELSKTDSTLKYYINSNIEKPTVDILQKYEKYTWSEYKSPNLTTYSKKYTDSNNETWYSTVFGNLKVAQGTITQNENNTFTLQTTSTYGKFESKGDGFAFLFKQLPQNKNFKLEGKITIDSYSNTKQGGFGIMLRDDCYINQPDSDATVGKTTNFGACGFIANDPATTGNIFFNRYNTSLTKSDSINAFSNGDVISVSLQQNGQNLILNLTYNGTTYSHTYVDYSFNSKDTDYIYCGFFSNRGNKITVSDIKYTDLGENQGA